MRIYSEISLRDFEFWSGAKDRAKYLTPEELDTIEDILEEVYPEGMDEIEVNDFLWFEREAIAEWLGFDSFEEIMFRDEEEDEDGEEEEN